ncbi:MAG TPA: peptidoglycan DD-metalloendopeptidase family protein, partial [Nannocystaceae bacterium]|nr:peptidoglycan DD-metalloendopeptidase family protein [Nannocystaceae bacterium]
ARSIVVVAALGAAACRFDSDGSETGGGGWEPAEDSGADASSEPSDASESDAMSDDDTAGPGSTDAVDDDGDSSGSDEGVEPDDCPRLRVATNNGGHLNVRPGPSTDGEAVGELPDNAIVDKIGEAQGEWIDTTDVWFEIDSEAFQVAGFVFSEYVECTTEEAPALAEPDGYWLPLECGMSATISQGNDGDYSHSGNSRYAFDFSLGVGTPLVAMADGVVLHRYAETMPGDPCYDGGGEECYLYANLVVLKHGDGLRSIYKHLSEVLVEDGAFVARGTAVGLSGSSGYSTGPHAHVMRQENCPEPNCPSIPLEFEGIGVPQTGDTVKSNNCP